MKLPHDHPQRVELNDEVHARPPEALEPPTRISYLALLTGAADREAEWRCICDLADHHAVAPPVKGVNHYSADFGPFRLKWERHTEFSRFTFFVQGGQHDPFGEPAIAALPAEWVAGLPGQVMVAAHVALVSPSEGELKHEEIAARWFDGHALIGSSVAGGSAVALTDFRIRADGFSRVWIEDRGMTRRQAGRIVQRLLEIDTYRVMALLALPMARKLGPLLNASEKDLAQITTALAGAGVADEPALLDRLTQLEAEIESRGSENHFRFSAAAAYYELVQRRIVDLREVRIEGLQTFLEFTEHRLAPAMNTCRSVAIRQETLSARVARATQLLSTRVDVTQASQNQELLRSMNGRAQTQLRLQETVEGLSVAAVTYYVVGLIGYAAKALKPLGMDVNPDVAMGAGIPVVLLLTFLVIRRIRKSVTAA